MYYSYCYQNSLISVSQFIALPFCRNAKPIHTFIIMYYGVYFSQLLVLPIVTALMES